MPISSETSGLDYTISRPAWLMGEDEVDRSSAIHIAIHNNLVMYVARSGIS